MPFPPDDQAMVSRFIEQFETDENIPGVFLGRHEQPQSSKKKAKNKKPPGYSYLGFRVSTEAFVAHALSAALVPPPKEHRLRSALYPAPAPESGQVVVEFSSPNVAKPFHVGHLRSTIIGNFVANVNEAVGHRVTRLNFLGDWGTQFGMLAAGLERKGVDVEDIISDSNNNKINRTKNVIHRLNEVYVEANSIAEKEPAFSERAKELFRDLEAGNEDLLRQWKIIRQLTVDALEQVYERLNVRFDEYDGESMYAANEEHTSRVLDLLEGKNLLQQLEDGRKVIEMPNGKRVTVVKSDGSTLYLTRDCAAAIHRADRYPDMERMLYVVETAQYEHFSNVFQTLDRLGFEWAGRLRHVQFGRVRGMSTRRGNVVFLSDILDEAFERMREKQEASPNTRALSGGEATDVLAVTAVVVNDLMQRKKTAEYDFSWDAALASTGGVRMQYLHSRLCSLLENNGVTEEDWDRQEYWKGRLSVGDLSSLSTSEEAISLVYEISRFDEFLRDSYVDLEPRHLVRHLFLLCDASSRALKALSVKGATAGDEGAEVANARLCLFAAARAVAKDAMQILGLRPLNKM